MANILLSFEQGICTGLSSDERIRCYEIHFQSLKSDFFQNNPAHLNFPYDRSMSLAEFKSEPALLSIWNDICKMGNEDQNIIIEYYCLNSTGPFVDYFKAWSATSGIYNHIIDRIESESLSVNQPKEIFLVQNDFDFSNIDDRIIYAILHITLAEEYKALKMDK